MLVRAAEAGGGEDVEKMVPALEGWSFDGVKGKMTIRASDHALLQPMFHAALSGPADNPTARITKTVSADECAPPVTQMKA
jgi:branched-chain amino acid transport system substrate-binding protein